MAHKDAGKHETDTGKGYKEDKQDMIFWSCQTGHKLDKRDISRMVSSDAKGATKGPKGSSDG